ncbi:hypothetical protein IWW36_000061 [Coemansia brasiliensis]|uniref:Uncharacterized protein n=1 Tax=Coemansia brasiliensis TaxID=2650707 RepID=A0A9W8M3B0_9FUNG|nr:hypothetical protein IWW36_000061 [Coemansia brasiliensis]
MSPVSLSDMPAQRGFINNEYVCTCGECPPTKISARVVVRIMCAVLQAMEDLKHEIQQLEPNTAIDDIDLRCQYPYNLIPPRVQETHKETLIGAYNILLVIYIIMQDGGIPHSQDVRELCIKEAAQLPYIDEYIQSGGSVMHILEELTSQVEGDLRGDALHVDSDELLETLEQIRPCALDESLLGWRRELRLSE